MHIEEIMKNIDIYETHISGKNGKRVKIFIPSPNLPIISLLAAQVSSISPKLMISPP